MPGLFLLLTACLLAAPVHAEVRVGRDRALRSLAQVTVETRFGTQRRGTGYLFGSSGNLMVPFHLVSDARTIQVFQADVGVFHARQVRRVEPRSDIAVLILDATQPLGTSFAHLSDSRNALAGEKIHVLHHPVGGDKVDYEGVLAGVGYARTLEETFLRSWFAPEQPLLELSGPFDSGSAGGLVLNENYDVIGMILGGETSGARRTVSALTSSVLATLLQGTYTYGLEALRTEYGSDAEFYDKFLGRSPQRAEFNSPMGESYLAWFSPMQPVALPDREFSTEVNDKISKNWFHTEGLLVNNRPLREWSASRIVVMPASVNPWDLRDSAEQFMHFDADSKFRKVIHRDRETEERIMTRCLLALALPPGAHKVQYVNRGANYKSTGIVRKSLNLEPGRVQLIDITGLSLVSMKLLPKVAAGVGEQQSVRYELERKPLAEREVNFLIRKNRFPMKVN